MTKKQQLIFSFFLRVKPLNQIFRLWPPFSVDLIFPKYKVFQRIFFKFPNWLILIPLLINKFFESKLFTSHTLVLFSCPISNTIVTSYFFNKAIIDFKHFGGKLRWFYFPQSARHVPKICFKFTLLIIVL